MRIEELEIGATYFMVTYPDEVSPVVISYRYLGTDLAGIAEDPQQFYFRYLPAFQEEGDEELDQPWREMHPSLFQGWGEGFPTSFPQPKVDELCDLEGLISELSSIRDRPRRSEP